MISLDCNQKSNFCMVFEYSPLGEKSLMKDYLSLNIGRVKLEYFVDGVPFKTFELFEYKIQ